MKVMKEFKQGIPLKDGVTRDLVAANEEYTITRMHMRKGVADPTHSHPHVQADYVISGCGELVVGDEVIEMKAGDCIQVESNVPHGFRLIKEDLEVLEFFVPRREDIEAFHS